MKEIVGLLEHLSSPAEHFGKDKANKTPNPFQNCQALPSMSILRKRFRCSCYWHFGSLHTEKGEKGEMEMEKLSETLKSYKHRFSIPRYQTESGPGSSRQTERGTVNITEICLDTFLWQGEGNFKTLKGRSCFFIFINSAFPAVPFYSRLAGIVARPPRFLFHCSLLTVILPQLSHLHTAAVKSCIRKPGMDHGKRQWPCSTNFA